MRFNLAVVSLMFVAATAQGPAAGNRLAWVDRSGKVLGTIGDAQYSLLYPAISPDATKVAVRRQDAAKAPPQVWIYDVARGTGRRLTTDSANEGQPAFSPDGRRIAYLSYRNGLGDIFIRSADGSGQDQQLTSNAELHDFAPSWSPDGKHIVFHTQDPKTAARNVFYLSVEGDRTPRPVAVGEAQEALASFSPDGRYLTYSSNESGSWEVYVVSFPPGPDHWKVSVVAVIWPKWSSRGDELLFFQGTALVSVPVQFKPAFKAGKPQQLFTAEQAGMDPAIIKDFNPTYDVARDARRFVVVQPAK